MADPQFPVLRTRRLILREIAPADADALFAIHGDTERMRWYGADPIASLEAAHLMAKSLASWPYQTPPGVRWALERQDAPGLIGTCGLSSWNPAWRKCTLGYEIAPASEGQGLMAEALRAALGWGFGNLGLNRVEALVHPANEASVRLLRHLGFAEEGRLRQVGYWGGGFHDMLQFSLLQAEWAQGAAREAAAGHRGCQGNV